MVSRGELRQRVQSGFSLQTKHKFQHLKVMAGKIKSHSLFDLALQLLHILPVLFRENQRLYPLSPGPHRLLLHSANRVHSPRQRNFSRHSDFSSHGGVGG